MGIIQEMVFSMSYKDIDNLASDVFGRSWEIIAAEELNNDSSFVTTIDSKLNEQGQDSVDRFIADGKGYPCARDVMRWLCKYGYLAAGKYVIDICW